RQVLPVGQRCRTAAGGEDDEQVHTVAEQDEAEQDAGQRAFEHEVDAGGEEDAHGQDHDEGHAHSRPPSAPLSTSSSLTRSMISDTARCSAVEPMFSEKLMLSWMRWASIISSRS